MPRLFSLQLQAVFSLVAEVWAASLDVPCIFFETKARVEIGVESGPIAGTAFATGAGIEGQGVFYPGNRVEPFGRTSLPWLFTLFEQSMNLLPIGIIHDLVVHIFRLVGFFQPVMNRQSFALIECQPALDCRQLGRTLAGNNEGSYKNDP